MTNRQWWIQLEIYLRKMCGIAGIVDLNGRPVEKMNIKRMTDAIKHRGPDGEGQWTQDNVGLGHRRLAIIDLTEAASQPMFSSDGRFVIIYNGELYNYRELRKRLQNLGHQFQTNSDTEVLMAALITWQEAALKEFNGMFAFAFYDTHAKKMMLARDRYGIKPLYYNVQDSIFTFCSEQKGINARSGFKKILDKEGLVEYLTFQNFFTDSTLTVNLKLLSAGHYLKIDTESNFIEAPTKYWDFSFSNDLSPASDQDYLEELDRLFRQACEKTLISDVEVGAYLSGGIDSSSIAKLVSDKNPNLQTFTVGFNLSQVYGDELEFDETELARKTALSLGTRHHEFILSSKSMEEGLKSIVKHIEEPRVGQSYPNYYASKLASQHVKVVLSGAGGDELFGGYPWRYFRENGSHEITSYTERYFRSWQRLMNSEEQRNLLKPIWSQVSHLDTFDIFRKILSESKISPDNHDEYINSAMYLEAKTFLNGLLIVEDKLSMSHGLETRVPFLENDLVDFALRLPPRLKVKRVVSIDQIDENFAGNKKDFFYSKSGDGKLLFRKLVQKYFGPELSENRKQGFSAPDATWFRTRNRVFIQETLFSPSNPLNELFDVSVMKNMVNQHFDNTKNRRLLIWSFLFLTEALKSY